MLSTSPSPRPTPSAHQSDCVSGFRSPNLRRENLGRIASSKSASPIIKPHSAHVFGYPLPYPTQSSSSTQTQSLPSQARHTSTDSTNRSQCPSLTHQHQPSVRSVSTQTSSPTLITSRPSSSSNQPTRVVMVDAQTQYSPPLTTTSGPPAVSSSERCFSPRSTVTSVTSTPTSHLANLHLNKVDKAPPLSTPSSNSSALTQISKRLIDPVADAAMPTAPSGLSTSSKTSKKEEGQTENDRISPNNPQPSVKREHSDASSEPHSPSQPYPRDASEHGARAATTIMKMSTTPAKKPRPADPDMKVMPLRYETCDTRDLVILISSMLMELIRFNDTIPLSSGSGSDTGTSNLTRFHSRAPPGISVIDYLQRLTTHATLSPPILLSMVYYIDRLASYYPAFTISSLTVHRFLITAATVASKGLSDSFWTNKTYARVGGVSVKELALLELEFLVRVQWRIVPRPETLVDYYKSLVGRSIGYSMEGSDVDHTQ